MPRFLWNFTSKCLSIKWFIRLSVRWACRFSGRNTVRSRTACRNNSCLQKSSVIYCQPAASMISAAMKSYRRSSLIKPIPAFVTGFIVLVNITHIFSSFEDSISIYKLVTISSISLSHPIQMLIFFLLIIPFIYLSISIYLYPSLSPLSLVYLVLSIYWMIASLSTTNEETVFTRLEEIRQSISGTMRPSAGMLIQSFKCYYYY